MTANVEKGLYVLEGIDDYDETHMSARYLRGEPTLLRTSNHTSDDNQ